MTSSGARPECSGYRRAECLNFTLKCICPHGRGYLCQSEWKKAIRMFKSLICSKKKKKKKFTSSFPYLVNKEEEECRTQYYVNRERCKYMRQFCFLHLKMSDIWPSYLAPSSSIGRVQLNDVLEVIFGLVKFVNTEERLPPAEKSFLIGFIQLEGLKTQEKYPNILDQ